jgi:hypothetical protein
VGPSTSNTSLFSEWAMLKLQWLQEGLSALRVHRCGLSCTLELPCREGLAVLGLRRRMSGRPCSTHDEARPLDPAG